MLLGDHCHAQFTSDQTCMCCILLWFIEIVHGTLGTTQHIGSHKWQCHLYQLAGVVSDMPSSPENHICKAVVFHGISQRQSHMQCVYVGVLVENFYYLAYRSYNFSEAKNK